MRLPKRPFDYPTRFSEVNAAIAPAKAKVEQLAQDRFGKGVKELNKLEASGLIEELLEQTGQGKPRSQRFAKGGAR